MQLVGHAANTIVDLPYHVAMACQRGGTVAFLPDTAAAAAPKAKAASPPPPAPPQAESPLATEARALLREINSARFMTIKSRVAHLAGIAPANKAEAIALLQRLVRGSAGPTT